MNETTHDEENSSEAEDDTSEDENVAEMQTYENNGEENIQEDKLLTTNFEVKVENQKVEGLITYSTDQQIFKFNANSQCADLVCGSPWLGEPQILLIVPTTPWLRSCPWFNPIPFARHATVACDVRPCVATVAVLPKMRNDWLFLFLLLCLRHDDCMGEEWHPPPTNTFA